MGLGNNGSSALQQLSDKIVEISLKSSNLLRQDVEERFGAGSKEFNMHFNLVQFEFMYFFLHYTNRIAYFNLSPGMRDVLQDSVTPLIVNTMIIKSFGNLPENSKSKVVDELYNNLNSADSEYGTCEAIFLQPKEDTSLIEKMTMGMKSRAISGQLVDNLARIITGDINENIFFSLKVNDIVVNELKKKEIDSLVTAASREL